MARVYDATMLSDFALCPEKARVRHELNLRLDRDEPDDPADAGSCWHAALREWFADKGSSAALAALRAAWGPLPLVIAQPLKRPRALYERLFEAYAERYPRAQDRFAVLVNEEWRTATFGGIEYGAIYDRVVEWEDGAVYVMDSKSTSANLTEATLAAYHMSFQLKGQVAIRIANGLRCDGALVDLAHVNTRSGKVEPEKHFVRYGPIRFADWQLRDWEFDLARRVRAWEANDPEGRWEQREHGCFKWNKKCPYWTRCQLPEQLAQDLQGFREEAWNPAAEAAKRAERGSASA